MLDIKKKNYILIAACWFIYTSTYLGKYSYNANITMIMGQYGVTRAAAGLVSSSFFFAYGAGQILHGLFSGKYNMRWTVPVCFSVSALVNLAVALGAPFSSIKYLWALNAFALAAVWPVLVRCLAESVEKSRHDSAVVLMGTTTPCGMLISYGLSALFIALEMWTVIFYAAFGVLLVIAALWAIFFPKFFAPLAEISSEEKTEEQAAQTEDFSGKGLVYSVIALCLLCAVASFVRDGLGVWLPDVLKNSFGFADSVSVIMTLVLPAVGIIGGYVVTKLSNKITDYVILCCVLFAFSAFAVGAGWIGIANGSCVLLIVGAAVCSCVLFGLANIVSSKFPLSVKNKKNAGAIAGILNGSSYAGSTISTYALGSAADVSGWNGVFELLFIVCAVTAVVFVIVNLIKKAICSRKAK